MKGIKKFALALTVSALICTLGAAFSGCNKSMQDVAGPPSSTADSYEDYNYGFEFESYDVTYDVESNRTMDVTMDLTVHYTGYRSTGFMYYIPVNDGDRVRNVTACQLADGKEFSVVYYVKTYDANTSEETQLNPNLIALDIGDNTIKTDRTYTYRIKYNYAVTRPVDDNAIFLNAVSFDSSAPMQNVSVTVNLPAAPKKVACFAGESGSVSPYTGFTLEGKTLSLAVNGLPEFNGIKLDLYFEDGVLSTKTDMTPYYVLIAACIVLAGIFALKLLVFNKDMLTPIANTSPPEGMDPMTVGKLIDGKVDNEDVTSMLYYWASKGYIKIDMSDEKDVKLIKIRNLPESAPTHEKKLYNGIFGKEDMVDVNALADSFFRISAGAIADINAKHSGLYNKKSITCSLAIAIAAALAMVLLPTLIVFFKVSYKLFLIVPVICAIPAVGVYVLMQCIVYYKYKETPKRKLAFAAGALGAGLLGVLMYWWLVPSYVMERAASISLAAVCYAVVALSSFMVCRGEKYVEKLNHIVGFKDFILTCEKDKLEAMLEGNPEFYFDVLPYAQVMGVSEIWESKFKSLKIQAPAWVTYGSSYNYTLFDHLLFMRVMHSMDMRLIARMRPSSSGPSFKSLSGGGFGGFGGGSHGGGHGGGGFRGR